MNRAWASGMEGYHIKVDSHRPDLLLWVYIHLSFCFATAGDTAKSGGRGGYGSVFSYI